MILICHILTYCCMGLKCDSARSNVEYATLGYESPEVLFLLTLWVWKFSVSHKRDVMKVISALQNTLAGCSFSLCAAL